MAKSIMATDKHRCYLADEHCGGGIELHHVYGGTGRRKISDKYGLTVYLCHNHHNEPPYGVHFNREAREALQAECQIRAMYKHGWTVDDFRQKIGKSYI